jgi:hypothetical protein
VAADAEKEEGLLQYVEFELRGPIASENRLTPSLLPKMLFRERLCFQHMPQCDSSRNIKFSDTDCGMMYHMTFIANKTHKIKWLYLFVEFYPKTLSLYCGMTAVS